MSIIFKFNQKYQVSSAIPAVGGLKLELVLDAWTWVLLRFFSNWLYNLKEIKMVKILYI